MVAAAVRVVLVLLGALAAAAQTDDCATKIFVAEGVSGDEFGAALAVDGEAGLALVAATGRNRVGSATQNEVRRGQVWGAVADPTPPERV